MEISTRLRVRELLREHRWTTKVLSEKTGMSESYLTHIKNGTRRWNEDALKKLAKAFELFPIDLFDYQQERTDSVSTQINVPEDVKDRNFNIKMIPVVGDIPSEPSSYNNQVKQYETKHQDDFVPIIDSSDADTIIPYFCLKINDNLLSPKFLKGDLVIIAPGVWTNSGDIIVVEYGNDKITKDIVQVNYMEDVVVLESVNHKKPPVALVRGKDYFKIIGKVIYKHQKL